MNFRLMGAILKISLRGGKLVLSTLTSPSRWFHRENVLSERSFLLFLFPSCSFFFFRSFSCSGFRISWTSNCVLQFRREENKKMYFSFLIRCLLVSKRDNCTIWSFDYYLSYDIEYIYLLYNKVVKYNICK